MKVKKLSEVPFGNIRRGDILLQKGWKDVDTFYVTKKGKTWLHGHRYLVFEMLWWTDGSVCKRLYEHQVSGSTNTWYILQQEEIEKHKFFASKKNE